MGMKKLLVILYCVFISLISFAQPDNAQIIEKDGAKFYKHLVSRGETAYGISKLYNIDLNLFFQENPAAENGLDIDQVIYIPVIEKIHTIIPEPPKLDNNDDPNIKKHVVKSGETIWSLSKKYSVSVDQIKKHNSNSDNLQIGAILFIPIQNADTNNVIEPIVKYPINPLEGPCDSIIIHKVQKKETLYSLSKKYNVTATSIKDINNGLKEGLKKGKEIRIKLKKVNCDEANLTIYSEDSNQIKNNDTNSIKDIYNVALMLPFFLDKNEEVKKNCPPLQKCPPHSNTIPAINLYNGVYMALDSLKKAGLKINLYVYDTQNDTSVVNDLISSDTLKTVDLIIGPYMSHPLKKVINYAKENNIHVIAPGKIPNHALHNNYNLTKVIPSKFNQITALANYTAKNCIDDNIIVIKNTANKNDIKYSRIFLDTFNILKADNDEVINILSIDFKSSLSTIKASLVKDKRNILVIPSTQDNFVSDLVNNKLNNIINSEKFYEYEIVLFGLEEWVEMKLLDEKNKYKFNLHVPVAGIVNYHDEKVIDFIRSYREIFKTDPLKYSFLGFDAAFNALKGLLIYGKNFSDQYHELENDGFYVNSSFYRFDPNSGFQNKSVNIYKYENYQLIKLD